MRKLVTGAVVSLFASASFAQSVITFDVDFHTVYAASGSFAPNLAATAPGPFNGSAPIPDVNLTGQVTISTVVSSTQLAPGAVNTLTLNGSWTSESGFEPTNTWSTTTYNNGASGIWSALLFLWGTPVYWFTSPWYRRLRVLTLGDFFEERYSSKRMAGFYAIVASLWLMLFIFNKQKK